MMEEASFSQDEELRFIQDDIRNRGNGLNKAWADLFSLLSTYQARLMVKENQLIISEKQIQSRQQQFDMLKEGVALPISSENLQTQLEMNNKLLSKSQTELVNTTEMLHCSKAELRSQRVVLEKAQTEKLEKEDLILHYQNRIAQLESELQSKDEESEIKDRLIKKLEVQNLSESSDASVTRWKEMYDVQTNTLDAERRAHKETRRRLQVQQRYGLSQSDHKARMPSVNTMSPNDVPAQEYKCTGFTSLNDPKATVNETIKNQQNNGQSMDEKVGHAMSMWTESYSVTQNTDWNPKTSTPQRTSSGTIQKNSNIFTGMNIQGADFNPEALGTPVPISDPVPSTSILRLAAEEAEQQQSESLRVKNKGPRGINHAYDMATLETAMMKVRSGEMSLRKAANFYNIPKTSLSTYVKELKKPGGRHGRGGCISLEEEREVIKLSLEYTEKGIKFGRKELLNLLAQYFESKQIPNPFKCGLPGKDWWLNVRKRHPDLIQIKSKASNKSIALKLQSVNESDTSANNFAYVKDTMDTSDNDLASMIKEEMDISASNESGNSVDLGLDVLREAAGVNESRQNEQNIYGPLMTE